MELMEKQQSYCVINRVVSHKQYQIQTLCSLTQEGAIVSSEMSEECTLELRESIFIAAHGKRKPATAVGFVGLVNPR